ncbi:MAG: hypothetical protein KJN66_08950 [Bacteroidia bacterium]|nr:hypothetical protein [Bacteroidia bacterium]
MNNTGLIITMAYPDTVVMVADEWYSPLLQFIGVGKKNYVKAGHAALVLINKISGHLEYHDFGRYITPEPNGRVRGSQTDHELDFPLKAEIEGDTIKNLDSILLYLANNPKKTHGDGKLIASVCTKVNYQKARDHIIKLMGNGSFRYAAFKKESSNCARFVTSTLIASITDKKILRSLKNSLLFTPSTVGNVVRADTQNQVFEVIGKSIFEFNSTVFQENFRCFLDKIPDHEYHILGTLMPKQVEGLSENAQWLSGIAAGAWFEISKSETYIEEHYRIRRVSPHGNVDVDGIYKVDCISFNLDEVYEFVHDSKCHYCHVVQNKKRYKFEFIKKLAD